MNTPSAPTLPVYSPPSFCPGASKSQGRLPLWDHDLPCVVEREKRVKNGTEGESRGRDEVNGNREKLRR